MQEAGDWPELPPRLLKGSDDRIRSRLRVLKDVEVAGIDKFNAGVRHALFNAIVELAWLARIVASLRLPSDVSGDRSILGERR